MITLPAGHDMKTNDAAKATDTAKRPYTAPVLQKWGSMSDLTRSVGNAGSPDGGSNGHKNRTQP